MMPMDSTARSIWSRPLTFEFNENMLGPVRLLLRRESRFTDRCYRAGSRGDQDDPQKQ